MKKMTVKEMNQRLEAMRERTRRAMLELYGEHEPLRFPPGTPKIGLYSEDRALLEDEAIREAGKGGDVVKELTVKERIAKMQEESRRDAFRLYGDRKPLKFPPDTPKIGLYSEDRALLEDKSEE
jgi:hypothetical protein